VRLKPGETARFRLSAAAVLYAKANTATVDLYYVILED